MKYILFILAIALLGTVGSSAQETVDSADGTHPNLHVIARSYGDSIVLRWGTTDHVAWKVAGSKGYVIERYEIGQDAATTQSRTVLTPTPIKPLTIDEWKARYKPDDTLAGAAVQALYGKPIITSDDPFGSIYEMYVQQQNLFGFALLLADMRPGIADGLGLRFVDHNVSPGRTYLYRLYSTTNNPDYPIDTGLAVVTVTDREQPKDVETLTAVEGEREVVLKWNRYEHIEPFTGYYVERSDDGGRTFRRLTPLPYIPARNMTDPDESTDDGEISYRIPLEENYRPVTYRVIGIDPFGEVSEHSSTIVAMGRDRTAPRQPQVRQPEIVDGRSLKLAWELDSVDADLEGFIVAKSPDPEGPFDPIGDLLPRDVRSFVDRDVSELPQHYYIVTAIDTAGNRRNSVPMLGMFPDSIPPAVPRGLAGTIDSNGIVTLRWLGNEEPDLLGYRVFYANQNDHEYQQLTTDITLDTMFVDTLTLETLSETIYYKVTALDRNYNHSEFTQPLLLKKPDIVAPAAPLVSAVEVTDRGVRLTWKRSPSEDVTEHRLYRRTAEEEGWRIIARSADTSFTTFYDTTVARNTLYEYSLDALDDAGLVSLRSNTVTARPFDSGIRSPVTELRYTVDSTNGRIVLRWDYPGNGDEFYLYKAIGGDGLALYRSIPSDTHEFTDEEIASGNNYKYGIRVVTADGGESPLTATESIELR